MRASSANPIATTIDAAPAGRRLTVGGVVIAVLAVFWLFVTAAPFLFLIFTSLKDTGDYMSSASWALPKRWAIENYAMLLGTAKFYHYLLNSLIVVIVSTLVIVVASAMAAYAFARIRFRFANTLFGFVVAALIVPVHVTLVPIYLMTKGMGLYDTTAALMGPYIAFALPVSIFILTEFMRQIPKELEEAAQLDGCGPFKIFWTIFFPLSGPGVATVAIFNGIMMWNEFIFAYVLTSTPAHRTLPLAIWDFQSEYASNIPMTLAVIVLTSLPLVIAYAFGQERIIKGMMAGSVKG
ncbi:carbohydrate ABC transporter permease [Pararobbsia silviterrae]|uniref:Carbohydrate ABC transporter permease n=1 Tax=Pararobbsia silviterrae TaxID=1792498 RepID=A0A494XUM7_9BURK|nr:carbohydrate ABC transporter permease [Pararobbsia silviterrae]RKP53411.1 carbohydrate ABC transporter permease [Pararobbsia silviterrae]